MFLRFSDGCVLPVSRIWLIEFKEGVSLIYLEEGDTVVYVLDPHDVRRLEEWIHGKDRTCTFVSTVLERVI